MTGEFHFPILNVTVLRLSNPSTTGYEEGATSPACALLAGRHLLAFRKCV